MSARGMIVRSTPAWNVAIWLPSLSKTYVVCSGGGVSGSSSCE